MITSPHVKSELKSVDLILEKSTDKIAILKSILKVGTLIVKLLVGIRTNQTTIMGKQQIPLIKSNYKGRDNNEKKIVKDENVKTKQ